VQVEPGGTSIGDAVAAVVSDEHAVAAGSAAALTGAVAAAIVAKAARLTSREAEAAQAEALQGRLVELAETDAGALAEARAALASRGGGETTERRDFALGQALRRASEIPTRIAETCADVALLAGTEREAVHPDVAADVAAAAVLAAGAAHAAAYLVAVNLAASENADDVLVARRAAAAAAEVVATLDDV
jgi:formiminotetrahydrofolate cyclodeaminase